MKSAKCLYSSKTAAICLKLLVLLLIGNSAQNIMAGPKGTHFKGQIETRTISVLQLVPETIEFPFGILIASNLSRGFYQGAQMGLTSRSFIIVVVVILLVSLQS